MGEEEKAQEASPSPSGWNAEMEAMDQKFSEENAENREKRNAEYEARQAERDAIKKLCDGFRAEGLEPVEGRRRLASAEELLHRRRLADTARMEAKDVAGMSPSELVMHRRRLAHGVRVSPVLAALMEQIEEAQRNHA